MLQIYMILKCVIGLLGHYNITGKQLVHVRTLHVMARALHDFVACELGAHLCFLVLSLRNEISASYCLRTN